MHLLATGPVTLIATISAVAVTFTPSRLVIQDDGASLVPGRAETTMATPDGQVRLKAGSVRAATKRTCPSLFLAFAREAIRRRGRMATVPITAGSA